MSCYRNDIGQARGRGGEGDGMSLQSRRSPDRVKEAESIAQGTLESAGALRGFSRA